MGNMRFKVGDRVRINSLDWYNENKDENREIKFENGIFTTLKSIFLGQIMTIEEITLEKQYILMEDQYKTLWTDEMIECKVEEETKPEPKFNVGDKIKLKSTLLNDIFGVIGYESEGYRITNISNGLTYFMSYSIEHYYELVEEGMKSEDGLLDEYEELTDRAFKGGYEKCKSDIELNGFQLPDGYIFKDDKGNEILTSKIILEKKKKEYPKTYEECLSVLGIYNGLPDVEIYNAKPSECKLFESLIRLKRCRDAYWKIAGEEMGLGKPWENSRYEVVYSICRDEGNIVKRDDCWGDTHVFEFPIRKMRDAFKENFDPDIEFCKEFL